MRDPNAQLEEGGGGGNILSARGRVEHTGLFGGPRASSVMLRNRERKYEHEPSSCHIEEYKPFHSYIAE